MSKEDNYLDDLVPGNKVAKPKKSAKAVPVPVKDEPPVKAYRRLYLFQESIELLDDITYSKEQQGDYSYTQGDAVREGLELLAKKIKASKAPKGYKKMTFI